MRKIHSDFAKRLKRLREERCLSQYALAKRTGLGQPALSRLELGEREPAWNTVQLLAIVLGISTDDFCDPSLVPPEVKEARPRGRPRKEKAPPAKKPGRKKKADTMSP